MNHRLNDTSQEVVHGAGEANNIARTPNPGAFQGRWGNHA